MRAYMIFAVAAIGACACSGSKAYPPPPASGGDPEARRTAVATLDLSGWTDRGYRLASGLSLKFPLHAGGFTLRRVEVHKGYPRGISTTYEADKLDLTVARVKPRYEFTTIDVPEQVGARELLTRLNTRKEINFTDRVFTTSAGDVPAVCSRTHEFGTTCALGSPRAEIVVSTNDNDYGYMKRLGDMIAALPAQRLPERTSGDGSELVDQNIRFAIQAESGEWKLSHDGTMSRSDNPAQTGRWSAQQRLLVIQLTDSVTLLYEYPGPFPRGKTVHFRSVDGVDLEAELLGSRSN